MDLQPATRVNKQLRGNEIKSATIQAPTSAMVTFGAGRSKKKTVVKNLSKKSDKTATPKLAKHQP